MTRRSFTLLLAGTTLCAALFQVPPADAGPTYRIYGTREGLVGGTTSNGHVIGSRDRFVALPSTKSLDCNGCRSKTVTIKNPANGRIVSNVPIWDVGPWNTKDDYWNSPREYFSGLAKGLPEAQAAYDNGYNGGKDQFGRTVANPAGIDLADGTFWDDLGMSDNGWLSVTYNFVADPYNNPPYDFHTDTEGFTAAHSCTLAYGSGTINVQQNGYDPFIHGPACNFAAQGGQLVYVRVMPQSTGSGCGNLHDMQVFWKRADSNYWDAAKSSGIISYTGLNDWKHIYLPLNSAWTGTINQLRVDFDQNNSGIKWVVDQVEVRNITQPPYTFASNAQGWSSSNGLSNLAWTNCCGWPGVIYVDQTGGDPWITGPLCFINGASTHRVHVRLHIQNTTRTTHDMQVFWVNSGDVVWGGNKSVLVNYTCGDDQWADVYLPVGSNSDWNGKKIVNLRLDFDQTKETDHTTPVRYLVDTIEIQ